MIVHSRTSSSLSLLARRSTRRHSWSTKEVICAASDSFRGCLTATIIEARTKTVTLPEDNPVAFSILPDYIYNPKCKVKYGNHDQRHVYIESYVLASKLLMEKVANKTVDIVDAYHNIEDFYTPTGYGETIFRLPESGLRAFLVEQLAWYFHTRPYLDFCECAASSGTCNWYTFFKAGGDDVLEVFRHPPGAEKSYPGYHNH